MAAITHRRGPDGHLGPCPQAPFAVDAFLAQPLVARLATHGLALQPVWYLWEDEEFWVITGTWSALERRLATDSAFALVVDTCDPGTGRVRQVLARGHGTVTAFDAPRGRRKLSRYLGPDEEHWDPRFRPDGSAATANRWARLVPDSLRIADLSFRPAAGVPAPCGPPRPTPVRNP
ncbi:pyridoxamine 5'-phosphate oxidase family protein [Streptomyces sp. NPDC005423]|uniref:pyridoxamine 5'-phosphate oxidase family protein n=1 Tax=Streptomyces sp. NPDC005423 TaxID=3155343 RepID=UPI0033A584F8